MREEAEEPENRARYKKKLETSLVEYALLTVLIGLRMGLWNGRPCFVRPLAVQN